MAFPIRVPCYGFKALHHGQNQNSIIPKDCNDLAPGIALRPTTLCARNFSTMKVSFYRHIDRFLLHAVSGDGQGSHMPFGFPEFCELEMKVDKYGGTLSVQKLSLVHN